MATILQLANSDRNLSSFSKGLKAADIENSVSGIGPFTILAPINLAFGQLTEPATFENLLKDSSVKKNLADILTCHIISGKKLFKDFRDGQTLQTVFGKQLAVTVKNGEVRINGAKILSKDRQGSNGVLHSIDSVNTPTS